ncbi:MAG TPA: hypothetical protein VIX14_16760 [Terriglobales bacterium]
MGKSRGSAEVNAPAEGPITSREAFGLKRSETRNVYERLGLEVLRKTWVNLDLIWAVALIATTGFTLVIPT